MRLWDPSPERRWPLLAIATFLVFVSDFGLFVRMVEAVCSGGAERNLRLAFSLPMALLVLAGYALVHDRHVTEGLLNHAAAVIGPLVAAALTVWLFVQAWNVEGHGCGN